MIIQKVLWGITLEWCIKPDLHGHGVVGNNANCLVPLGVKTQIETILYVAVTAKEPRQVQLPVVSARDWLRHISTLVVFLPWAMASHSILMFHFL